MLLPSSLMNYEIELAYEEKKPDSYVLVPNHDAILPLRHLGRN